MATIAAHGSAGIGTAIGSPAKATGSGTAIPDAQDRFLKMLVAQMKNQDPLNPVDNAQFTTQLAQISTVNGIERLNETMASLRGDVDALNSMQAVSLAGRQVLVSGNTLSLADGSARGGFELSQAADRVDIAILDQAGLVVQTTSFGLSEAGLHSFDWDGRNNAGTALPDGIYRMRISAAAQGKELEVTPLTLDRVTGVNRDGNKATLNLATSGTRTLADIRRTL